MGDLALIAALGTDERVMASLGGRRSAAQSRAWLDAEIAHWSKHAFGRFFVSREDDFVGLVGLSRADFDAGILPSIEVAWRLVFEHWGHGYATEAARAVLGDAASRLGIRDVVAVTTLGNVRSQRVMRRLGMHESVAERYEHPRLPEGHPLRVHVVYRLPR